MKRTLFTALLTLFLTLSLATITTAQSTDELEFAEAKGLNSIWEEEDWSAPITRGELACLLTTVAPPAQIIDETLFKQATDNEQDCLRALVDQRVIQRSPDFPANNNVTLSSGLRYSFRYFGYQETVVTNPDYLKSNLPALNPEQFQAPIMYRALTLGMIDPATQNYSPTRDFTRADALKAAYQGVAVTDLIFEEAANAKPVERVKIELNSNTSDSALINDPAFAILEDAYLRITTEYLEKDGLDTEQLIYDAIAGMLKQLDTYSTFFDPVSAEEFNESINGEFIGVGIALALSDEGEIKVVTPIKGSPAEEAGIESGDIVTAVDGQSFGASPTIEEAISVISGAAGTSVRLTIRRGNETLNYTITRALIVIPSVEWERDGGIAIVRVYNFGEDTADDFSEVMAEVADVNIDKVVLDLRGNPGGFLSAAEQIASLFVPKGSTIVELQGPTVNQVSVSSSDPLYADFELAILVNAGSASASEILAAALKHHNDARVIGEQTFGKGTVQDISFYSDGSSFKLTIAEWLTPDGSSIDGVGITPDISETAADLQEDRALESF